MESMFPVSGVTLTGDYLMKVGLHVNSSRPLSSMVLEITEQG
jgi:hypothetical protein